jgi:hypothetical protein
MHVCRSIMIGAAILLPTACGTRSPEPDWPALEHTEFIIQQGDSIIATERTARSLDRLRGEISMPGVARAEYVATLSGPGTLTSLHATLRPWTGGGEEAITVRLLGDSLTVASSRWDGLPQTFDTPATAVYLHPSPALLELLLRRALLAGDTVASVPVWLVNQHAPTTARVHVTDGQTWIDIAGTRVRVVHEDGYLLMGEVAELGWVFTRR